MKRFVAAMVVLLFMTGTAWATDKGNHYGWYKHPGKPGNTASTATASSTTTATATAAAFNISTQWMNASQSMNVAPGAFTSNVATGPTNVTTGPTNVNVSGMGGSSGGVESKVSGYVITQFPEPYVSIPIAPLAYNGPEQTTPHYANDQLWFKRKQGKWISDMVKNLPSGGKITEALYEKAEPVKFFYAKDGRTPRLWCYDTEREVKEDGKLGKCRPYTSLPTDYHLGSVYCDSASPSDKPGIVWGGCARKLLEKGCSYAVLESGVITQGARSNAVNAGGGASFAGIFGAIFGFNAGVGASNTDHEATMYEIVNLTWGCYGVTK